MSDIDKLRAFAQDVMKEWPLGEIDGADLAEYAERHGLIVPVKVAAPCNDRDCVCAEVGNLPGVCYRRTALLTGDVQERR